MRWDQFTHMKKVHMSLMAQKNGNKKFLKRVKNFVEKFIFAKYLQTPLFLAILFKEMAKIKFFDRNRFRMIQSVI